MISSSTKLILLIGLLSPLSAFTQDDDVKADAAISFQQNEEVWAGQQVTLNLDLKTTGFSFSNSHFNLPEVNGAFLMQTDTTTIKLTENINGETWQIVRYPLALYPQKAGRLKIPSIDVRFNTSAGFGRTEKAFEFQTRPLELAVNLPPGVKEGDMVVTTTSFKLDHNWQPQTGTTKKTGDAFTLTLSRRANDISAMLFPPLPVFRVDGLAAYPQAPEVSDKSNRGDLTGERIDSIIWVAEKPGTYDIPGIRFQWWDPDKRELKQQIIPGLNLDIQSSPMDETTTAISDKAGQLDENLLWLLLAVFAVIVVVFVRLKFGQKTPDHPVNTEKSTFAALQKACSGNQPGQAHSAIHAWLEYFSPAPGTGSRPVTLSEFAVICNDKSLASELERLQEGLVTSNSNWRGSKLLNSLQGVRQQTNQRRTVQSKVHLAPLNP